MKQLLISFSLAILIIIASTQDVACQLILKSYDLESPAAPIMTKSNNPEIMNQFIAVVIAAHSNNNATFRSYFSPDAKARSQYLYEYSTPTKVDSISKPALQIVNDGNVLMSQNDILEINPVLAVQSIEIIQITTDTSGHLQIKGHRPPATTMNLDISWIKSSTDWKIFYFDRNLK